MIEPDYKSIGKRIRAQRESLGYTREQLAERLDVSPKFCSDIELGVRGVSLKTLVRISEILSLSTDYMLFGEKTSESVEQVTLVSLFQKCPEEHRSNLLTVVRAFVDTAVNLKK